MWALSFSRLETTIAFRSMCLLPLGRKYKRVMPESPAVSSVPPTARLQSNNAASYPGSFPIRSLSREILIPIIDFDIIGRRVPCSSFSEFSETQHEGCPFHAAMRGELVYLAPVLMGEEDDGVIAVLVKGKHDVRSNPFLWTRLNAPMHFFVRI